jgi:DNA polymerase-3 subunit delta
MPVVEEADVRRALTSGRLAPLYLLVGDDGAGRAPLIEAFEAIVDEGLRAFNYQRFYADDPDTRAADIVAAARTFPMMADRRVVVVMRAESLFKGRGRASATEDGGEDEAVPADTAVLEEYLAAPVAQTCLVLVASDVNRSLRQTKLLVKQAEVVEFWGLKADREAKGAGAVRGALERGAVFVVETLRGAGLGIDKAAIGALLEHAGTDIALLRNVVGQLAAYASARDRVTLEDVHALARGAAVVNDWALTDAVAAGAAREALAQLRRQLDEGRSPFQIHGMLAWWVRDKLPALRERQLAAALESTLKADLDLKSSADSQVVLERFVVELCEGGRRG